ncbi:ATP-binding protein [Promineifilum sp.]|uniref:ATP-binding protein n=1 Tax=Promineifilum sp. TaxID=2664178 RepID=UPI0035B492A0
MPLPAPTPLHILPAPAGGLETALFGFQLPYLPDFLTDYTLLADRPAERIGEALGRMVRFVLGLRKYHGSAYALRYVARPERGQTDVYVLGRLAGPPGRVQATAAQAAADLAVHLVSHRLTALPLAAGHAEGQGPALRDALFPFDRPPTVVEIRQQEDVVPLLTIQEEAYVIYPYWSPAGAFLEPFESLLRQPHPAAISIYLEPTELTPGERAALFEAAHLAETVADLERRTMSDATARRLRDPGAELVGRLYNAYRKSLDEPFLLVVQVAGPDPNTVWTVARGVGAAISAAPDLTGVGTPGRSGEADNRRLPSQAEVIVPRTEAEAAAARRAFTTLTYRPWAPSRATPGKERLPYLAGAEGAAAAFRFPISVRGGVPGIAVRQPPPDFEVGPRQDRAAADELHLGALRRGGAVTVKLKALSRHGLITGFTGSGKTNTVLYLLDQLWRRHRLPFLVIESAKKEYRGLLRQRGFESLLIFTLGDETAAPFRLNPFELMPGVRLEAHLGRLQTCFNAALPQFGILPSIIQESLDQVYRDKGWRFTDRGGEKDALFPTMRDFFRTAVRVSEGRGYAGETYQNIRAAVGGRIGGLLLHSKGRMFNTQRSYPLDALMNRPVILELNDLSADDKALTMMFLLMLLREYRELHPAAGLQHVTVIEEAHNVMGNVKATGPSEVSADTKGQAVQAFADLLTEVRAYGEGILISDQSPEKLLPDAVRNTNLQVAHQLRDAKDREAIGRALIMDEAQRDYLGKLRVGEAAVFLTGMEKATFMQVPPYKDETGIDRPATDADVSAHMARYLAEHRAAHLPFDGCRFCTSPCRYVELLEPQTREPELHEQFVLALRGFDERPEPEAWPENWRAVAGVCARAARAAAQNHPDAAYCFLAQEIDFPFTEHMRREFIKAYESLP